jgi:hypothetical protein
LRLVGFFFDFVNKILKTVLIKKIAISVVAQEDLSTTVKSDNTLAYEWQSDIYHVAVPCTGMKKGLRLYFVAVILLIISIGMAQTETLSKWLPHRKKAANNTELRSWNCNNNKKKKKIFHTTKSIYLVLWHRILARQKERGRDTLPRSRKQTGQLVTFGGIAVIAALIAFMIFLQVDASRNNDFKRAFEDIVIDTNALTQQYTSEEDKWLLRDNNTMIQVIDQYLPRYDELIERAKALNTPEKYKLAHDYLVSAIELERQSYQHFRNYLATADQSEYEKSSEMISQSLEQSVNADAAVKVAG